MKRENHRDLVVVGSTNMFEMTRGQRLVATDGCCDVTRPLYPARGLPIRRDDAVCNPFIIGIQSLAADLFNMVVEVEMT